MTFEAYREPGIPVLSFFTGAGFLDMGFIKAGFNVVYHNEFNPEFARGFRFGMSTWFQAEHRDLGLLHDPVVASIDELNPADVIREAFGGPYRPRLFGMIGGPPCPDFSVGGKNRGSTGENGKLSQTYVDLICAIRPTFFLFENVPGLFRTAKHRAFFDDLVKQLEANGYITDVAILNALEYGVPQDRERVFFVGVQTTWMKAYGILPSTFSQGRGHRSWFPYPEPLYPRAKTEYEWADQTEFGSNGGRQPKGTPSTLMVRDYLLTQENMHSIANGADCFRAYSDRFFTVPEGDDSKKSFKRLHRYRYSPTVAYGNNEVHLHPFEPRRLSVREALRLQSVPDSYALPPDMTLSNKFKTVGNGVPVRLAEAVAVEFRRLLTDGVAD